VEVVRTLYPVSKKKNIEEGKCQRGLKKKRGLRKNGPREEKRIGRAFASCTGCKAALQKEEKRSRKGLEGEREVCKVKIYPGRAVKSLLLALPNEKDTAREEGILSDTKRNLTGKKKTERVPSRMRRKGKNLKKRACQRYRRFLWCR